MAGRTPEDERFIESFKDYVDLLVDESCNELKGEESVPKEKFEGAGRKLVEASKSLKITQKAENFVSVANDLAEYRLVTPEMGAVCSTPSGNSIYKLGATIKDLNGYFEKADLTLSARIRNFEGRPIISMCLGEAENIDLPVGPKVTVFTKMIIEKTRDTIGNKVLGVNTHSDWTNTNGIFHQLEPKLNAGGVKWHKLEAYSSLKSLSESYKLDELAWTALSLECEDEKTFSEKYAATCIENIYPHELYHWQMGRSGLDTMFVQAGTPTDEAAAQLYAMSRGSNPFNNLRGLYGWKDVKLHTYSDAAGIAFKQLKKAGYKKSLWKKLKSIDAEKVNAAGSEIRGLADAALTNLEADRGWRNHTEVERELGLERNYQKLHDELQKLEAVEYGK